MIIGFINFECHCTYICYSEDKHTQNMLLGKEIKLEIIAS